MPNDSWISGKTLVATADFSDFVEILDIFLFDSYFLNCKYLISMYDNILKCLQFKE